MTGYPSQGSGGGGDEVYYAKRDQGGSGLAFSDGARILTNDGMAILSADSHKQYGLLMPFTGKLKLSAKSKDANSLNNGVAVKVYKNGSDASYSVTLTGTTFGGAAGTLDVAQGDYVSIILDPTISGSGSINMVEAIVAVTKT